MARSTNSMWCWSLIPLLLASLASFAQVTPPPASNDAKLVADFQQRAKQYLDWRDKTVGKAARSGGFGTEDSGGPARACE